MLVFNGHGSSRHVLHDVPIRRLVSWTNPVQQQLDALVAWHNPTCYFPVQEGFSVFS